MNIREDEDRESFVGGGRGRMLGAGAGAYEHRGHGDPPIPQQEHSVSNPPAEVLLGAMATVVKQQRRFLLEASLSVGFSAPSSTASPTASLCLCPSLLCSASLRHWCCPWLGARISFLLALVMWYPPTSVTPQKKKKCPRGNECRREQLHTLKAVFPADLHLQYER